MIKPLPKLKMQAGGRKRKGVRWLTAFTISLVLAIPMFAIGQEISLSRQAGLLKDFLKEIKRQSGYDYVYNANQVNDEMEIVYYANGESLEKVLSRSLGQADLEFSIQDEMIIINPKSGRATLQASRAAQQYNYSGQVKDDTGVGLPGVTVKVNEQQTVVVTDEKGLFSFQQTVDEVTVELSMIGFKTIQYDLRPDVAADILMEGDISALEEVMVVGYGVQKRKNLTAAVSQVSSEEITRAPVQNLSNMLTGKLPGLTSIQNSGMPGQDGTSLLVRGVNSFTGSNSPMILVDGVPRLIDYVNPNDVESVTVLKDAAAAIYGIQGANGVILITTKKGFDGAAKIQYDGSTTLNQNTAMPEMLNAADYMYWHNKARSMDGLTPLWDAEIQNRVMTNDSTSIWGQTDWMDLIFRTGVTQNHNISASGGSEKTKYYTSLGLMDQEGTLINTDMRRFNVRGNLDVEVAKKLNLEVNLSGHRVDRHWPGTAVGSQTEFNPIRQAINSIPIIKSEYQGFPTGWTGSSYKVNGYAALNESGYNDMTNWTFDSSVKLEYDAAGISENLRNLKISIFGAYNYSNTINSNYARFYQLYTLNPLLEEGISGASGFSEDNVYSKSSSWGDFYLWRPEINYTNDFGKHHVGAMLLFEAKQSYSNTMTGTKRGYYSDEPVDLSLGTTLPETPISGSHVYSGGQVSYVGRVNYAYNATYLAELAFRYDGSYIFAPENRWGFFPSASVAWVISNEKFFQENVNDVNMLKLRASYGNTGNDAISPFQHNSLFALANNSMVFGGQAVSQFYSTNPYLYRNLTWASTDNYNLGLDVELWNGKLGAEFNVFYKLTKDILESQGGNYPPSLGGYYPSFVNSGRVENKGFELSIRHSNVIDENWSYSVDGHVAYAKNKVLSRIVTDNVPNYRAPIGESIGARYGFEALGLFQTLEELDAYPAAPSGFLRLGDLKYRDVNGDGIISSQFDYMKIGYGGIPEFNFGLNLDLNYKALSLSMLWQGVTHVDYELSGAYDSGVIASTVYTDHFSANGNSPYYLTERAWTLENTNAEYPRLSTVANGNNAWQSSWWVVNGEYLRLKNVNLSFTLPADLLSRTPFSGLRLYVAGTNLLTFSHFKYVDPESPSVSNGYYPQQKTYSLGLNVTF